MTLTRRDFLYLSSLSTAAFASQKVLGANFYDPGLPSPDFTYREGETRFVGGLRPYRDETYRLEIESINDKFLVHNYGHGGAGITMSWGSAHEVVDFVNSLRDQVIDHRIAVLGAGAIGLTSAYLLREMGYQVTIYAQGFLEETTSHIAGGQFAPSTVAYHSDGSGLTEFQRILRRSFRTHESKLGKGFGVSRIRNFTESNTGVFEVVPKEVIPDAEFHDPSPLQNHRTNYSYQTLLIEPPIFLRRLEVDLREAGVWFRRMTFVDLPDVCTLPEKIIVNCMGLGAGSVCKDEKVVPIKGQLVLLKPQRELNYLYSGIGYIFPRRDAVVVGGSFKRGLSDPTPVFEECMKILDVARAGFEPRKRQIDLPDWILQDKHL